MTLRTRMVSGLLFPLQERFKGHDTVAVRRALERTQWWTPAQLRDLQCQRLEAFMRDVYAHVPYYRQLLDRHGIDPDDIRTPSDLRRLPFLTKEAIRANAGALEADDARGLERCNTGGSSGEPLVFHIGRGRVSHDVAAKWRATRWWGVDIGDPEIVLWGSPIELGTQDRVKALRDRLFRTRLLSAFELNPQRIAAFLDRIRAERPRMLFGYPSAFALLAEHAEREGIVMNDLGIRVAFVTSERLYDHQRERIERVFGCPVANGYGGRDAGFVAHQCPEGGMHISAEDIIVEIVDSADEPVSAGESGELVVTHLATRDFPFIRYRTGDVAALDTKPCACGRGLPMLREIHGRTTDFVVAADGTMMHGLALIYVVRDLPEVGAFKIVQEDLQRTRVYVVPATGYSEDTGRKIRAGMQQRLGEGVDVAVEPVEEIAPERSGKFRYVVSKVAP